MRTTSLLLLLQVIPHLALADTTLTASGGIVAADSLTASRTGAAMLARGGDAVDAAVATALVLGVVQPFASGIGGGGFAIIHRVKGEPYALDFREVAPGLATRDMYLDPQGEVIPGASQAGPKAAAVPGEAAGLYTLHKRHGKLPWRDVVAPAIKLANEGFPCNQILHEKISYLREELLQRPALRKMFLTKDGAPIPVGGTIKRPLLAQTLRSLAAKGAQALYGGEVGKALTDAMKRDGGLIRLKDLESYKARRRPLVDERVMGARVLSMPPPSSGGAVLVQILRVLEGLPLRKLGWNSAAYVHRITEAMKHAFADRANVMGDPGFVHVPIKELLSPETRHRVRAAFNPKKTLPNKAYGGRYKSPSDGGTSHLSVVDKAGNAVALTTTINTGFGSLYVAGTTGIIMNNEMDDFVAAPGVPNAFGLVGREANAIAPGKVPLSSMSPTIVLKRGRVLLVVGGSGGPTIITGTLQAILNVLLFEKDARAAVRGARFHHQWQPDTLYMEGGFKDEAMSGLKARGHDVQQRGRFNAVQMIRVVGSRLEGASDPSKYGRAAGVKESGEIISEDP